MVEITAVQQNEKNKDSQKFDNIKYINIHMIGVLEGEEREKGPQVIFEEI